MKSIIIFCMLLVSVSFSETLEELIIMAKSAPTQEAAAEKLLALSLEGEPRAMTALGRIYLYGKGVPQNCKKGTYFLLNAVSKSKLNDPDPEAMKELGLMFRRGLCVDKSEEKYEKYFKKYVKMKEDLEAKNALNSTLKPFKGLNP